MKLEKYQLSGELGSGIYVMPPLYFLYSIIVGFIYGFLASLNPWLIVGLLLTCGMAILSGFVYSLIAELSNCRNLTFIIICSFIGTLLCMYSAWVGFFKFNTLFEGSVYGESFFFYIFQPIRNAIHD